MHALRHGLEEKYLGKLPSTGYAQTVTSIYEQSVRGLPGFDGWQCGRTLNPAIPEAVGL